MKKLFILKDMKPIIKNKTIVSFVIAGIYEVLSKWVIYDTGTKEENIKYLTELTIANMRHCEFN